MFYHLWRILDILQKIPSKRKENNELLTHYILDLLPTSEQKTQVRVGRKPVQQRELQWGGWNRTFSGFL